MNILILGSGGREHALAWRLAQDESAQKIYVWPGNIGMTYFDKDIEKKLVLLNDDFSFSQFNQVASFYHIDLVIPGAERYIYLGVKDWCNELGLACLSPTPKASYLEKSKIFSKKFMLKSGIPTSKFFDISRAFFHNDQNELNQALLQFKHPVVKIAGPSLGKGVFVCENQQEAMDVLRLIQNNPISGIEEGIFIEEKVDGDEVSMFFACEGETFSYLGSAQDHKRLLDENRGPNTGGMGAISPVHWVNDKLIEKVKTEVLIPTLKNMKKDGNPFSGILFLGLMVKNEALHLLEYNVRFGDPETQAIMPMLQGDLSLHFKNLASGNSVSPLSIRDGFSFHVVKSSKGYPGNFGEKIETGYKIIKKNLTVSQEAQFFFSNVKTEKEDLITNGGRVFGVTALGRTKLEARNNVYQKLNELTFKEEHYRKDIGGHLW